MSRKRYVRLGLMAGVAAVMYAAPCAAQAVAQQQSAGTGSAAEADPAAQVTGNAPVQQRGDGAEPATTGRAGNGAAASDDVVVTGSRVEARAGSKACALRHTLR